jgi:hypothetical protein
MEDFTKYSKNDPQNRMKVLSPTRIDFTAHDEISYMWKEIDSKKSLNLITKVKVKPRIGAGFSLLIFYSLANELQYGKYFRDQKKKCIWICFETVQGKPRLAIYYEGDQGAQHNGPLLSWNKIYSITIVRSPQDLSLEALDEEGKNVSSLKVRLEDSPKFQYFFICNNWFFNDSKEPMWFRGEILDLEFAEEVEKKSFFRSLRS